MKHQKIDHPSQISLSEKHAELLRDVELVAIRANANRGLKVTGPDSYRTAAGIVEAAEVCLVRVLHDWRASRGGNQNNLFFNPLSKRLRRIIDSFKRYISEYDRTRAVKKEPQDPHYAYEITDYESIPFERLRPFFRASAVDDAIRMGIKLGLRELPGLRIFEENPNEREA